MGPLPPKGERMVRREILPRSDQNHVTQCYCAKVSGLSARPKWEEKGVSEEGIVETDPRFRYALVSPGARAIIPWGATDGIACF